MICHCCDTEYEYLLDVESTTISPQHADIYRCPSCSHIFRDYSGDANEYHKKFYRKEGGHGQRHGGQSEFTKDGKVKKIFHDNRKNICQKRVDIVNHFVDFKNKSLHTCIDIGSGAGTFAMYLKSSHPHLDIECIEMDPRLVSECQNLGFNASEASIFQINSEKKYDVVFKWHVLEHILDVKGVMTVLEKITKKTAVIEVPLLTALNNQGRSRKLINPNISSHYGYEHLEYDGHYHYFTEKSFRRLVQDSEFNITHLQEGVQSPSLLAILEKK